MRPKTERFELRLDEEVLNRVDEWRSHQTDEPSRAEAVRRLVDAGLRVKSRDAVEISDGEKLIIAMLADIMKQSDTEGETNSKFILSAIYGGHYWGLKWNLTGLLHDHADKPEIVRNVVNILDMWCFLESAYGKLSKEEKGRVDKGAPLGKFFPFRGFDGNYESSYLHVAHFLVNDMNRFTQFKGRDLNSHVPSVPGYLRMYKSFEPMRVNLGGGRELNADNIIRLLQAGARTSTDYR